MFNVLRNMDAHTLQNLTLDDFNGLMARFATEAAAGGNGGNGGNAVPQVVHAAAAVPTAAQANEGPLPVAQPVNVETVTDGESTIAGFAGGRSAATAATAGTDDDM